MLAKLLARLLKGRIKGIITAAMAVAAVSVTDESVEAVKTKVKREIQRQHKVPGELRKVACWWVDDQDATSVLGYIRALEASLA